ncbi:non-homologous end-joining DNA ligase [Nocardiopsis halophila]|uniref:non-homologous end-joining DNA ligase n=1 Tax=Nocardiopsis halophila TaxID=141692 RepID=UPI0003458E31|nr:non-homologous end-joining DNA ligase [Nocardiopsis halophila]
MGARALPRLHHPDKELFGPGGPTKRDLADHCLRAAARMLPHLRGRPLAVQRWPEGIEGDGGFFVKNRWQGTPDWVGSAHVPRESGGEAEVPVCNDRAALVWLCGQDAFPLHIWMSRADRPRAPDRIVFDLDPSKAGDFAGVRSAARDVRAQVEELGLAAFVMTTGSRGLHVVCPILRRSDCDDVKAFARAVAERVAGRRPGELTTAVRKDKRRGRVFIDYLRNGYAQLAVAPYSVRARPGAPVATPVDWDELDGLDAADRWTVRTFAERDGRDPWKGFARHARSPQAAMSRLEKARDA